MKIEKEIRFFFSNNELPMLIEKLNNLYEYANSYHEITTMYDNPNQDFTFYSKRIDGRLRLRYSKIIDSPMFGEAKKELFEDSKCLVTWKRRAPGGLSDPIRKEEEIEYSTPSNDFKSVKSIFENVLKCKRISSYERIRNIYLTNTLIITCDQFPYGVMLELELKDNLNEEIIFDNVDKLGLNTKDSSSLSCDDMYFKLCKKINISPLPDILFSDTTMPKIK